MNMTPFIFRAICVPAIIFATSVQCQPVHETSRTPASNAGLGNDNGADAPGGNGDIVALEKTRTASVVRANRYLDSVVSCLGTRTANARAKAVWEENRGSLSEEGAANSITSPMLSAMAKISGEVCLDLINKERNLTSNQRRIFNRIDFSSGPASVSGAQVQETVRRLSRSCWGRNETQSELSAIETSTLSAYANSGNGAQETIDQMVYLCTAMTSSFSTFEM